MNVKSGLEKVKSKNKSKDYTGEALKIIRAKQQKDEKIKVTFENLDLKNDLFNLGKNLSESWLTSFMDAMKQLTNITRSELASNQNYIKQFKPHGYKFKRNCHKCGDNCKLISEQVEGIQLRVNKGYGRIHGYFIDNIYYVVHIDPYHNMSDCVGYPKHKKVVPPEEYHEKLEREYNILLEYCFDNIGKVIDEKELNKLLF